MSNWLHALARFISVEMNEDKIPVPNFVPLVHMRDAKKA